MTIPIPAHEAARLAVLQSYAILDTPPEHAFERVVNLAVRLFHVPIALVSLVDADRQWFKACFGLDTRQTDRQSSFCAYAILSDNVMVVPDALEDPRFIQNTLVAGQPFIRFYAGAPLITPQGYNLGSLCIIDTVPREFSSDQQATLADLAAMVVEALELRRTARDLRDREAVLHQTLRENSRLATAIASLATGVVITNPHQPNDPIIFANAGFSAMTGYSLDEIKGQNYRVMCGPATDPVTLHALRAAIAAQRPFSGILLNYRKDGTTFLNELIMTPVFDADGQLMNFIKLQHDVTAREDAKQVLEQRVQERTSELDQAHLETLIRLARAAEFRDDDTGQHTYRVARTAELLARALGLSAAQVQLITHAAPLHDVGKIAIADGILLKPGPLTPEEFAVMQAHTTIGAALLTDGPSEVMHVAEQIALAHHERWDGKGYPRQLAGEAIPLEARILAVADVFDALTHDRPYKPAYSVVAAVAEIMQQRGQHFDPQMVDAFLTLPHADLC